MMQHCADFFLNFLLVSDGAAISTFDFSFDGEPESDENSANSEYALLISI